MTDVVVILPPEYALELLEGGFEERFNWRGGEVDVITAAVDVAGTALQVGADGIAILLGVHQIPALVRAIRLRAAKSLRLKTASTPAHSESIDLKFTFTSGGHTTSISVAVDGSEDVDKRAVAKVAQVVRDLLRDDK